MDLATGGEVMAEVPALLRVRRHQRGGRIRHSGIARDVVVRRASRQVSVARGLRVDAPQFVVGILKFAGIRAVLDRRGAVVVVIRIVRSLRS